MAQSTLVRPSRKGAVVVGIGLLLVVAIAVAVGVLVYRFTEGGELNDETDVISEPSPAAPSERPPDAPEGYIRVDPSSTPWSARLGGAMGLVIAVAIGAIVLALSLSLLVSLVGRLMSDTPPAA